MAQTPASQTRLPFATLALVVANLTVAFVAPFSGVIHAFAFDPSSPTGLTALTSLFLHDPANILHLLGNMVFLAAVGPLVESAVGPIKVLLVYMVSGLTGVAVHWAISSSFVNPSALIGASASISGMVGYCSLRYMRRSVTLAPNWKVSVVAVIVVWLVLQVLGTFFRMSGGGGVAYHAHVAGFIAGFVLAFVLKAQTIAMIEEGHGRIDAMDARSPAAASAVAERHLRDHPHDTKALWALYEARASMGEDEKASNALIQLLSLAEDEGRIVRLLASHGGLPLVSPTDRMKLAARVDAETQVLLYRSVLAEPDDERERPNALLAIAQASNGAAREAFLKELSSKYAFHTATEVARARGLL